MNRYTRLAILLFVFGVAFLGCGRTEKAAVDAMPTAETSSAASEAPAATPAATASTVDDAANAETKPPTAATYTPPFPNRIELFEPPQRSQSAVRRDSGHGETVELKGFIHVDEPRVVLSIDGVVSSVPAGGEKYGVQVISIDPPTVVLQRGRDRWPATLE